MTLHPKVLVIVVSICFAWPSSAPAKQILSVEPDTVIQENFLGVNAVYHAFTYLPESLEMGMTPELRRLELERVKESGVRIVRTFYRPDWAMGEGPWLKPDWESDRMKALYAWLNDMQRLGVDVALNMGWWFPRDVIWNRDQYLPTYPDDMQAYSQWVSESVHQLVQVRGFTHVKYLLMFTEPADAHGNTPGGKQVYEYYREVLRFTHQRLVEDGRRNLVKIVGPNTSDSPKWLEQSASEMDGVIDIYASHRYNFTTYQEWHDMAQTIRSKVAPTGKPFWIDEYGVQDFGLRQSGHYGTILALANAAFMNAGASASFLWILNDQYYPTPLKYLTNKDAFLDGKHSWGLYPWLPESRATRPAWDAFALLSRLMGEPGGRIVKTTGIADLPIAATKREDGALTLMVVNGAPIPREVEVHFFREVTLPIYRYAYNPEAQPFLSAGRLLGTESATTGASFDDTLKPYEVAIYTPKPPTAQGVVSHQGPLEAEGSDNLALHKEVRASSADPEWPSAQLTDGKRLTSWRSKGLVKRQQETVTVDLGEYCTIRHVELFPGYDNQTARNLPWGTEFQFSTSTDGRDWQPFDVKKKIPQADRVWIVTLPSRTARYVRVAAKAPSAPLVDGLYRLSIGEVKVFGQRSR